MTIADLPKHEVKPAVHYGMSFADYAAIDALNWHTLEPHRVSAKEAQHKLLHPDFASDSQVAGEAFHCAILEPERFASEYITRPKFDGHPNSKLYKDAREAWEFDNASKVHLSLDDMAELRSMQEEARRHPVVSAILNGKGRNEMSMTWRDAETGAMMKGRVDRLSRVKIGIIDPTSENQNSDAIVMADFKTTRSIPVDAFNRDRAKYGYHAQIALYLDGVLAHQPGASIVPVIVAVQNVAPFDVVVHRLDDDMIENGRRLYRRLLNQHLSCSKSKRWPGISDYVCSMSVFTWEKEPSLKD